MVFCSIRKRISLTASSMDNPNTSNALLETLTCSGPGMQSEELGLSSNKTGERSASCGTSIFSSTLPKKECYISVDGQMDLDRLEQFTIVTTPNA